MTSRLALALFALALVAPAGADAWCDPSASVATADGTIAAAEYPGFSTGVGDGFGGMIGDGVELYLDSDATGRIVIGLDATGGTCTWGANDSVVLYVDALPGVGFADTTGFDDVADGGRAAASAMGTDGSRADLVFPPALRPDHAIVLRADSATLFRLRGGGSHTFVRTLVRAPSTGFDTACVRELEGFTMSDLGSQPGNPVIWIATLLNASNGYRANEFIGVPVVPASNIGAASFSLPAGSGVPFASHGLPLGLSGPFAWIDFALFGGTGFTPTPDCAQLSSENWAATGFSDGDLAFGDTRTTSPSDYTRGVHTTSTTGGIWAFEVPDHGRTLGVLPGGSDFTPGTLTLRLRNDGATTLSSVGLSYSVLVRNDQDRANTLDVAYSIDGTSFTALAALRVTSPELRSVTPAWEETPVSTTLSDFSIPPGTYLYIRFTGDDLSGALSRDKFAIDHIVVMPLSACGDGTVDAGEACDAGSSNGSTACGCQTTCAFAASGLACGAAGAGACAAPATCDGAGVCVDRVLAAGAECRAASGACDLAEVCDGTSAACPIDAIAPLDTVCAARDAAASCDVDDVCDGIATSCTARVAAAGTECRASTGACDLGASCDGTATACPPSAAAGSGTPCRAVAGVCDVPESCTGSSLTCPTDAFETGTVCRIAAGGCDVAESCNGSGADCPVDAFAAAGTTCRAAAGACDAAESCTGASGACPTNASAPDGTACGDALACNGTEACVSGACTPGTVPSCDDGDECTTDACVEPGGCASTAILGCCSEDADCDDGDPCTADTCVSMLCEETPICADAGVPDAGGLDASVSTDAGISVDAGAGDAASSADGGGARTDALVESDAGDPGTISPGCSCRASAGTTSPGWLSLVALAALAVRRRRRR